jgi:hypothetical protein
VEEIIFIKRTLSLSSKHKSFKTNCLNYIVYLFINRKFVQTLNDKNDLMGYILMKLVKPSINLNYIVKANTKVEKKKLISEIGIFGVLIG